MCHQNWKLYCLSQFSNQISFFVLDHNNRYKTLRKDFVASAVCECADFVAQKPTRKKLYSWFCFSVVLVFF